MRDAGCRSENVVAGWARSPFGHKTRTRKVPHTLCAGRSRKHGGTANCSLPHTGHPRNQKEKGRNTIAAFHVDTTRAPVAAGRAAAAREKTNLSRVTQELLQGWLAGTYKLKG
jgi:hypothetical protein